MSFHIFSKPGDQQQKLLIAALSTRFRRFFIRLKKVRVRTWRIRIVFTRPHENAKTIYRTVFPGIISGGDYFFFRTKRGRLFEERRLFEGGD